MKPLFTPEELEELRKADEEIEREFRISREERDQQRRRDLISKIENSYGKAAKQREYYEANRDSLAAKQREYYEANRDSIAAKRREYREANRLKHDPLSEIVRELRTRLGLTQKAMASIIYVSQPLISLMENGAVPVNVEAYRSAGFNIGE